MLPAIQNKSETARNASNQTANRSRSTLPAKPLRAGILEPALLILAVTLVLHGPSLFDGKVLDDFWHQKGLREHGWGFSELLRTLIIRPSDFIHTWWQQKDFCWHYFRPLFILCMKVVFLVIGRGNPMALHAFSILLHYCSAMIVWRFCWQFTQDRFWSLVGGLLFAVYPHSVITVAWPSSQNCVLQTTLLLGAMWCYMRASGLDVRPDGLSVESHRTVHRGFFVATVILWLLAMLSRENAVLMPAIFLAFDIAFGGRGCWRNRFPVYAVFGVIGTIFVAVRLALHIPPLPDVYCRLPDGNYLAYGLWLSAKFLHYVCASIWIAPMSTGPTGRFNPWLEAPGDCLFMLAIDVAMGLVYWRLARNSRGWWIWPLWIALSVLPVLPVVATPHSGYMCGVGFAIGASLAAATARRHLSLRANRWAAGGIMGLTLGMVFMAAVERLQWVGIFSAERYLHGWVVLSPPTPVVRDAYFINMPFVNVYCKPNLVDRLGPWFEEVDVHVLTYSPQVLQMDCRTTLHQEDAHSFTVSIEDQAYFSRLMGRFVLGAWRGKEPLLAGEVFSNDKFGVKIIDADGQGVWKLRFTFAKPLNDPTQCFYLSSRDCGAARIWLKASPDSPRGASIAVQPAADSITLTDRISRFEIGDKAAAASVLATVGSSDSRLASQADAAIRRVMPRVASALGASQQAIFDQPQLSKADCDKLMDWWRNDVDQRSFAQVWQRRHDFDDLIYLRAEVEWDRWLASFLFKTDLYLTGRPFPGPAGPLPSDQPIFVPAYRRPWLTND